MNETKPRILPTFLIQTAFVISNLPALVSIIWLDANMPRLELGAWLLLALGFALVFRRYEGRRGTRLVFAVTWCLIPFAVFSGLSSFWSVAPGVSVSRWLAWLATVLVGSVIGLSCDIRCLMRNLGVFMALILLVSAVVVLVLPGLGVMNYYSIQGAWKGIYWHKNHMGLLAGFAAIVFLGNAITAAQDRRPSAWAWGVLYVLALGFVSQTDSAAAYISLIIVHALLLLALGHLRLKERLRAPHYAILGVVALLVLVALSTNLEHLLGLFNRKANLTGRVPMWGHLFGFYLAQRPWAGYGFNAFWQIPVHRTTMQQFAGYPDPIVIADNGFIDILMNTGFFGLALFLFFYVALWVRVARHAWHATDVTGLLPFTVMAYVFFANLTWSLLFENEFFFMLILAVLLFSVPAHALGPSGSRQRAAVSDAGLRSRMIRG